MKDSIDSRLLQHLYEVIGAHRQAFRQERPISAGDRAHPGGIVHLCSSHHNARVIGVRANRCGLECLVSVVKSRAF